MKKEIRYLIGGAIVGSALTLAAIIGIGGWKGMEVLSKYYVTFIPRTGAKFVDPSKLEVKIMDRGNQKEAYLWYHDDVYAIKMDGVGQLVIEKR